MHPFSVPGIRVVLETFTVDSLDACINVSATTDTLRTFQLIEDFATINYKDCFEVKWSKDMTNLPTVSETRLLAFWTVPPKRQSREEVANTLHLHFLPDFVDELHTFRSYRTAYRLLRRQDQAGAAGKLKRGTMFKFSMVTSPVL